MLVVTVTVNTIAVFCFFFLSDVYFLFIFIGL
jgi:hypothetical protein